MGEFDAKNRGDAPKRAEINLSEQFLNLRFSQFRELLDEQWQQDPNMQIVIQLPKQVMISGEQKRFLAALSQDSRVKIIRSS